MKSKKGPIPKAIEVESVSFVFWIEFIRLDNLKFSQTKKGAGSRLHLGPGYRFIFTSGKKLRRYADKN